MSRVAGAALVVAVAVTAGACDASHHARTAPKARSLLGRPALASSVAADFALRDQSGRIVRLSAERGHVVLVTFLYTHCPDVCPLIAGNLNAALRSLGPLRRDVRVLAISVDPRGDTPRAVRTYVREHRLVPEFRYLTGSQQLLRPVWQSYNVLAAAQRPELVDHSAVTLLVDPGGRPRVYFGPRTASKTYAHDVRRILSAVRAD